MPPQNKYGFNAMSISNVQMDRPFPIPPGNAACPPWFPPPTHMTPWQPPFLWGPFRNTIQYQVTSLLTRVTETILSSIFVMHNICCHDQYFVINYLRLLCMLTHWNC